MKKYVATFLFFCAFCTTVFCQTPRYTFGVRSGFNFADYELITTGDFITSDNSQHDLNPLFTLSVPIEIAFSKHFMLQTELNFVQKGYKRQWEYLGQVYMGGANQFTTNWLEIPFLAKLTFGKRSGMSYGMFLGPSVGYALSGRNKMSNSNYHTGVLTTNVTYNDVDFEANNHRRFDFGLNVGGDISYKNIFLDVRYELGTQNLTNIPISNRGISNISKKTRSFMLTLGYRLPILQTKKVDKNVKILRGVFFNPN